MERRFPRPRGILFALCGALVGTGCEPRHSWLRPHHDDDRPARSSDINDIESYGSKFLDPTSDEKNKKPFFSGGGRSGGWSSRAREIEKNLGYDEQGL